MKTSQIATLALYLTVSVSHAALSDSLIGYYPFESDYSNSITTGGLPNGTAVNSPAAASAGGKVGNAMSVQGGDNDHMNLVASFGSGNTLGDSFTISAWYNLNDPISSPSSTNRYFVFEASDNYDVSYGIRDLGLGAPGVNDGQAYTAGSNEGISDAATAGWHHVIQRYTTSGGTTTIETYIDGSLRSTLSDTGVSGAGFNFGAARSSSATRGFDGLIDEVAIWNRALTSGELATVYALGLNSHPLISSPPADTPPVVTSFTATPAATTVGGTVNLAWNVTGSDSVSIIDELNNVTASGNQNVTVDAAKTYTLVAIKGNAVTTSQVSISVTGPTDPVGPLVGTVTKTDAYLLYRPGPEEINMRLTVMTEAGATVTTVDSSSLAANDHVAKFHVTGLTAGTKYLYKFEKVEAGGGTFLFAGDTNAFYFNTVPAERTNKIVTAGFISCVNDTTDALWTEMGNHNLDVLALCGDTPYIDTGDLTSIRNKHRHFLQRPTLSPLLKNISIVGTWDDHDFGLNGGDGLDTASRKVNTRKGLIEYRAHDQYGDGAGNGIYHKTDLGAMEIFMVDPRWFSQTAASPVDPNQSTCLGSAQWQWLLDSIRNSQAPFKVIVTGQIWQNKKNSEWDDWFTYYTERDKLLDIIRDEKISGVVLFGGDIHVARYLMHPQRVGYDLHDFIMSPGHKSVISSLNVYHPDLEWSNEAINQFLTMKADTTKAVPELTVQYLDKDGNINHELVIPYNELTYKEGSGLAKDLRAVWTFDDDTTNQSILGSRLDATAVNGATRQNTGGVRGGAMSFTRSNSQYLSVPRSFLDDNASVYTVSAWCKSTTLPAHGSSERQFIMESKVNDHVNLPGESTTGYAISVGLRATSDPSKINLQLYTETLLPRAVGSQQQPGTTSQGGFDCDVDRSLFTGSWANVVVTFDSNKLQLYLNGTLLKEHTLPTAAPIAETGGLVIGGHRSGTGRNFDGLIDEVAIWNRVLTATDVTSLYNGGSPAAIPTDLSLIDSDTDGIPDYWESIHGMDINAAVDALVDIDHDGLNAIQEFCFGTLPQASTHPAPYQQSTVNVSGTDYQSITYQRDPAATEFFSLDVQHSTDLGISDAWDDIETIQSSLITLPNGLQQVTERSLTPIGNVSKEFLRIEISDR